MQKFENCTDIFLTDALYARQFSVDSEGKLVSNIVKLITENDGEVQNDFSISSCISQFNCLEGYFSRSSIAHDHLLCAHGSSLYVRKEARSTWLDRIEFEQQITALLPVGGEKADTKTLCVTGDTLEILTLNESGSGINRGDQLKLPGKVLTVEIGEL